MDQRLPEAAAAETRSSSLGSSGRAWYDIDVYVYIYIYVCIIYIYIYLYRQEIKRAVTAEVPSPARERLWAIELLQKISIVSMLQDSSSKVME